MIVGALWLVPAVLALAGCASTDGGLDRAQHMACVEQARTGMVEARPGNQAFAANTQSAIAGQDPSAALNRSARAARGQASVYDRCMAGDGYLS